jgi:ankyrin repeat protein
MLLCHAARKGSIPDIESILNIVHGTDNIINSTDADRSALSVACGEGHTACVEYLLKKGASIHLRDAAGRGPMWHALQGRHVGVIEVLMHAGAHFSWRVKENQIGEIVSMLLRFGAGSLIFRAAEAGDVEMLGMLHLAEFDFNQTGLDGRTALHHAATAGQIEAVKYFLGTGKLGIDVDAKDAFDNTAMDNARSRGWREIVELLAKHIK